MLYAGPSLVIAAGENEFWLVWERVSEKPTPLRAYPELWRAFAAARIVMKWADRWGKTVDDFLMSYFEIPHENRNRPTT